jgi:hypothetical protein
VASAEQDPVAEQGEAGAAVHLPLDHLGPGVHSLSAAVVAGQGERGGSGLDAGVEAVGEGMQKGQVVSRAKLRSPVVAR